MIKAFKHRPGLWLVALAVVLAVSVGVWWNLARWQPDAAEYPVQGVWLTGDEPAVSIPELPGAGASFLYVTASEGARVQNDAFTATVEAARKAGMQVGAVHRFDPCISADRQSANFVTVVPRDAAMLAPAVMLTGSGDDCSPRVRAEELESELVVFLNQIEMHAGQRAILAPSAAFEAHYHFGARAERGLWLSRDWLPPEYAGRPWELWTANAGLRIAPVDGPVHWVVARP